MELLIGLGAWALLSLSLFNALALLWLGLTMFLAAAERRFGLWLILAGMVMAGLFLLSHTAILTDQLEVSEGINVDAWWRIGWLPIIAVPLLWYMVILWYAGFWERNSDPLRRHRYPLALSSVYAALLLGLHVLARPLPSFERIVALDFSGTMLLFGAPAMLILYPPYAILCVLLPLHVIRHPAPPRYEFGHLARQRARPWLLATAILMLTVAVLIAGFVGYILLEAQALQQPDFRIAAFSLPTLVFDLGITGLIAAAIVSLGRAVTAYEIFTGKTLPRRGFVRQWYTALVIAALLSAYIGYSLIVHSYLLYALVTMAGATMIAYAVLSWRTFVYRDQTIANLRPFVSGRSLLQNLIHPEHDTLAQAQALFDALCNRFLGATRAQITPDKALSMLVNTRLIYPAGAEPAAVFDTAGDKIQQLDPQRHGGFHWLIPLWSERGRMGVLLLGEKVGGGLYTEEEMQVAQSAGERILDLFAGEIMARHLVRLQRRRVTEQRVMDFRTRRTLHDRSLPALHEAILALAAAPGDAARDAVQSLSQVHQEISNLIRAAPLLSFAENGADFLSMLRAGIQTEFAGEFDRIHWQMPPQRPALDDLTADVLYGAVRETVRNAAVHGRGDDPNRPLSLWIEILATEPVSIAVRDNGVGLQAGYEHTGGSGSGMALYGTLMALLGGSLSMEANEAGDTVVHLSV